MQYEEIKRLIEDVGRSNIDDISLDFPDGLKINIKKGYNNSIASMQNGITNIVPNSSMMMNPVPNVIPNGMVDVVTNLNSSVSETKIDDGSKVVTSPVVGTFYTKSSPTATPYVKVGQKVKKGDVLCIIEAMKLMNEIESEYSGEIIEILAKDEELVDYGKPLFKIKEV